jgi:hypothetical protein
VVKRTLLGKAQNQLILKFYEVMGIPVLPYGSECWYLTKQQTNRTEAAKICFFRAVVRHRLVDKKRNEDIRKEYITKQNSLNIRKKKLEDQRILEMLFKYNSSRKGDPGRP